MITQRIRRTGNSFVVTIPKEEAERLNLSEGDFVGIEIRKMQLWPELVPELREAFERSWEAREQDFRYLAER
jgi:antitoxin component of MazEF toxin-antitoxin module